MKFMPWILLSCAIVALANCKKVEDNNMYPPEFSAKKAYKNSDNQFVIEDPMLWEMPLLGQNAKLTAEHVCQLLDKTFMNYRDSVQYRKLKTSVRGVYMGHDAFGQMTGLEYGSQDEIISEMYCQDIPLTEN